MPKRGIFGIFCPSFSAKILQIVLFKISRFCGKLRGKCEEIGLFPPFLPLNFAWKTYFSTIFAQNLHTNC